MRAQISYRGSPGVTRHCIEAVAGFIQECRSTGLAILISGPIDEFKCRRHALILTIDEQPELIVPDGFASGYLGEGPRGLSTAISILRSAEWDIREVEVDEAVFSRISTGAVSDKELGTVLRLPSKPISYVFDYLSEDQLDPTVMQSEWEALKINIPLPLIEPRLFQTASKFWSDPDALLSKAYRVLEDAVRQRAELNEQGDHGAKLFSRAFGNDRSPLVWITDDAPSLAYAQLFTAAYTGFRNRRAHRDPGNESDKMLALELMQLNTLFVLESQLERRADYETNGKEGSKADD